MKSKEMPLFLFPEFVPILHKNINKFEEKSAISQYSVSKLHMKFQQASLIIKLSNDQHTSVCIRLYIHVKKPLNP